MTRSLLLVEDHDGLRTIIGSFLSKNFIVTGAKNGLDALGLTVSTDVVGLSIKSRLCHL